MLRQMPIIKSRGKSAHQGNGVVGNQSLLKIESVVPAASRNPNKSIYRSYSTLSSGYFKKINETKAEHDQRKSNTSNVQNGFWRIQRSSKEKEKLPDRINLDRRGLTSLPVIEDEANLRLLSLQHNLINVFHVPDSHRQEKFCVENRDGTNISSTEPKVKRLEQLKASSTISTKKPKNVIQRTPSSRNICLNGNVVNKPISNGHPPPPTHQNHIIKSSFIQKSVFLHAKERYVLKKSNSFINSYSQHLAATKAHLGRLMQARLNQSSSDSTQETDNKSNNNSSGVEGLVVKNESQINFAESLQNLVFLDLYDNQIDKISSLDGLKSLTVLLLGKNRINDITGIISVKGTLRVLDLHGNKISNITQKICQLQELKSLNLAGNSLKTIHSDDFKGLFNLRELNLKRNKIKKISGFDDLRNLERLWLCHNDLQKVEDMSSIAKAINLKEVTIENNPVSLGGDCVSFLVSYLPTLISLSQMQVTEQVRRAAMAWRKSKESSDAKYSHLTNDVCHTIRREEVISNARTNWELLRTQQHIGNKSSSFIQKTIKNTSQQLQVPVSDIEGDMYSNCSTEISAEKKLCRQKSFMNRVSKTRKIPNMKRSCSQDNFSSLVKVTETQEDFFRLPPILAPFQCNNGSFNTICPLNRTELLIPFNSKAAAPFSDQNCGVIRKDVNSSCSSLGPNVDSSSSCVSSAEEDEEKKKGVTEDQISNTIEHTPPVTDAIIKQEEVEDSNTIDKIPQLEVPCEISETLINQLTEALIPLQEENHNYFLQVPIETLQEDSVPILDEPPVSTIQKPVDDDSQSDKTSNLSSNSQKTISDGSMLTNCSADDNKSKSKSANPNRKNTNPLIRSHTAKNVISTPSNQPIIPKQLKQPVTEREREQGGDYLIEICGRYLNVYGAGAIKFIDRQWNIQKANDVHTFKFSYVNFNSIATVLNRIKVRFPNVENFVFRETNITNLGQLNALAEIQGISSLVIDPEGNLICTKNWRLYAIYRLSHWGIKTINGEDVTPEEIEEAQAAYTGLSDLVLWSLPDSLLEPLLARLRLDENFSASKLTPKQWLMDADQSLKAVVGKEALQCKKVMAAPDESVIRLKGRHYFATMMENTCNAVEKLQKLEALWPNMLVEMVTNTLLDYAQVDVYVKNLMTELMKGPP